MIDGFWLGVAAAFPFYYGIDHFLIPFLVDLRTSHARNRDE